MFERSNKWKEESGDGAEGDEKEEDEKTPGEVADGRLRAGGEGAPMCGTIKIHPLRNILIQQLFYTLPFLLIGFILDI